MLRPRVLIGMLIGGPDLRDLMNAQTDAIGYLLQERDREELVHVRYQRDLIGQFSTALEQMDEEALRNTLYSAFSDLSDHVARLEEHCGI